MICRNIDKVDDTMDDIREQMDLASEISNAISNPLGLDTGIDEDELAAELEQLEQVELDASLLAAKAPVQKAAAGKAPEQAVAGKMQAEIDEERELEELRASMAI